MGVYPAFGGALVCGWRRRWDLFFGYRRRVFPPVSLAISLDCVCRSIRGSEFVCRDLIRQYARQRIGVIAVCHIAALATGGVACAGQPTRVVPDDCRPGAGGGATVGSGAICSHIIDRDVFIYTLDGVIYKWQIYKSDK